MRVIVTRVRLSVAPARVKSIAIETASTIERKVPQLAPESALLSAEPPVGWRASRGADRKSGWNEFDPTAKPYNGGRPLVTPLQRLHGIGFPDGIGRFSIARSCRVTVGSWRRN
jgi:hypothetical protein